MNWVEKIMTELLAAMKTYSYFINDGDENNKSKRHKKVCNKKKQLKFQDYKNCLEATQLENKTNQLEKKQLCR